MARRLKPRTPRRAPEANVSGQMGLFGSAEPWQPTRDCRCWPVTTRGCGHCRTCDGCQDCGNCAGTGCSCTCDDN